MKDIDGQDHDCIDTDTIRCSAVKGAPKTVSALHEPMQRIEQMRMSTELTRMHIQDSQQAAWESQQLLARLRREGI